MHAPPEPRVGEVRTAHLRHFKTCRLRQSGQKPAATHKANVKFIGIPISQDVGYICDAQPQDGRDQLASLGCFGRITPGPASQEIVDFLEANAARGGCPMFAFTSAVTLLPPPACQRRDLSRNGGPPFGPLAIVDNTALRAFMDSPIARWCHAVAQAFRPRPVFVYADLKNEACRQLQAHSNSLRRRQTGPPPCPACALSSLPFSDA